MASINFSVSKKFLTETGMRASYDAVIKMQEKVKEAAEALAKMAAENANNKKRKTIMPEDLDNESNEA